MIGDRCGNMPAAHSQAVPAAAMIRSDSAQSSGRILRRWPHSMQVSPPESKRRTVVRATENANFAPIPA